MSFWVDPHSELVRFPHDEDPNALWIVLGREGSHLLVRPHGVRSANRRRRLAMLAVPVRREPLKQAS